MKPHQHPTNNFVLGAPPGATVDQCRALSATLVLYDDDTSGFLSYWMPSDEERRLIAEGKPIRLSVLSRQHPPVALGVDGDGVV